MKTNTLKAAAAVGLSALLMGSAAAQSVSKPVGYETLDYTAGFNYLGLRLVEAPAASGASVTTAATVVSVADGVADALTAGTTYLFEATTGDALGAVTTVTAFDAAADTVTLADDISGDFEDGDEFIVRPVSTLESVFGATNDVANSGNGLASAGSFGLSDQIWIPDGTGSFSKIAYVAGNPFAGTMDEWQFEDGTAAPLDTSLVYTDGVIIVGQAAGDIVVSGSVKLESVSLTLTTTFNYAGSIFPVGLTLAESGLENTLLKAGSFGLSDQLWLSDGAGGFTKIAYVAGNPFAGTPDAWQFEDGSLAPTTTSFDDNSGVIVVRGDGNVRMITVEAPQRYTDILNNL